MFIVALLRTAWVCDDAYITLRTVDNLVHGYGLTWNIGERVQAYTHPLWMFLLAIPYTISGNAFLSTIFLAIATSLAALALYAWKLPENKLAAILGLLALLSSKFYIDYSTSGLENPLSHLLIVFFFIVFLKRKENLRSLALLSLLAALLTLTRMDILVLILPAVLWRWWRVKSWRAIGAVIVGGLPLIVWELFSVFYYGSFIPNTAFAKLNTGLPKLELAVQGSHYLEAALRGDFLMVIIIVAAVLYGLWRRNAIVGPAVVGIVAYIAGVTWAGGGFMGGRFFTGPLLVAVIILSCEIKRMSIAKFAGTAIAILVIGLAVPGTPLLSGSSYGVNRDNRGLGYNIDDHRYLSFQTAGLITQSGWQTEPHHDWVEKGRTYRKEAPVVGIEGGVGYMGFYSGPGIHIVDFHALTDPLLCRLPTAMDIKWRMGHFRRGIPDGYIETQEAGVNHIRDPYIAAFYDSLSFAVKGPLWEADRIKAAVKLSFGGYDYLLELAAPVLIRVEYQMVSSPVPEGVRWWDPRVVVLPSAGVRVCLDSVSHADSLEISLDNNDDYILRFFRGGEDIAESRIKAAGRPDVGLAVYQAAVPPEAISGGFDEIRVVPVKNDGEYALGHLILR